MGGFAFRLGLAAAASAVLGACASLPLHAPDAATTFYAHGRISVHYHDLSSAKEDTVFGRFDWIEHGQAVDVSLLDPLGQGIATVHAEPHRAVLKLASGQTYTGDTPDALTQEALGYSLPISGLKDWLTGRSASGAVPTPSDDGGLVLHDQGWTVHYASAAVPPTRVDLSYPGPGVALEIRMALEKNDGS